MTYIIGQEKPPLDDALLVHFGVRGMRWGVRRSEASLARNAAKTEAKTAKREAKAEKFDIRVAAGEKRLGELNQQLKDLPPGFRTAYKRSTLKKNAQLETDILALNRRDAEAVRAGKMTSTQKKLVVGAAVVGVTLLAIGAYQMKETGQLNSLSLRGKAYIQGNKAIFAKNAEFARKDLTADEVLAKVAKGVNPNYNIPGGRMNCRRASMTYELRRRGYDVQATTSAIGAGQSETGLINALTPGARNKGSYSLRSLSANVSEGLGIRAKLSGDTRINPAEAFSIKAPVASLKDSLRSIMDDDNTPNPADVGKFAESLRSSFSKYPPGARGEVVFDFQQFGHSLSWENFNGKPAIFDTQKGTKYDLSDVADFARFTDKWGMPRGAEAVRLDNVPLDMNFVSRWATNSKR